jgi:HD-like signal output (HDOD) protein
MHDASRVNTRVSRSGIFALQDLDLARKATIETAIRDVVNAKDYVPPTLPRAAMEVIALAQRSDVSFQDLERIMSADPMLAARVLRRAQSPAFAGSGGTMQSLREGLVRLGITGIRNIVLEESMRQRIFRAGQYQTLVEAVAEHASRVALAARSVARYTSLPGDDLYLLGLLHDIGVGLALSAIVDKVPKHLHPSLRDVVGCVTDIHEELGASLTKAWGLPPSVSLVVEHHHNPIIGGHPHPLACVLVVAEDIVDRAGGAAAWDRPSQVLTFATGALGLSEVQVRLAMSDYTMQVGRM